MARHHDGEDGLCAQIVHDHAEISRLFDEVSAPDSAAARAAAVRALTRELVAHEAAEQGVSHWVARRTGNAADLTGTLRRDERRAQRQLRRLEVMNPDDPDFDGL